MKKYSLIVLIFLSSLSLRGLAMAMVLESPAFQANTMIPQKYTCGGEDISPALVWKDAPSTTQSFALIMEDPDALHGTWVHWILFNISPKTDHLAEAATLPEDAVSGINSWNKTGYGGPCPPSGTHRYFFKLYALDTKLNLDATANKQALLQAMQGHILENTQFVGVYTQTHRS